MIPFSLLALIVLLLSTEFTYRMTECYQPSILSVGKRAKFALQVRIKLSDLDRLSRKDGNRDLNNDNKVHNTEKLTKKLENSTIEVHWTAADVATANKSDFTSWIVHEGFQIASTLSYNPYITPTRNVQMHIYSLFLSHLECYLKTTQIKTEKRQFLVLMMRTTA